MFFGGGFPSSAAHTFTNGRARYSQQTDQRRERAEERGEGGFSMFIQLIPIVVLILVSILSQLMVSTPPYSLYSRPYVYIHTRWGRAQCGSQYLKVVFILDTCI
nr:dnaJ homolog subfamily B member 14-like [Oncorhynchus nerka]